jgi:hypothetical protein
LVLSLSRLKLLGSNSTGMAESPLAYGIFLGFWPNHFSYISA